MYNCYIVFLVAPDSPVITGGPIIEVIANRSTEINCVAINGKPAPRVTWSSGGVVINESTER